MAPLTAQPLPFQIDCAESTMLPWYSAKKSNWSGDPWAPWKFMVQVRLSIAGPRQSARVVESQHFVHPGRLNPVKVSLGGFTSSGPPETIATITSSNNPTPDSLNPWDQLGLIWGTPIVVMSAMAGTKPMTKVRTNRNAILRISTPFLAYLSRTLTQRSAKTRPGPRL